MVDKKTLFIIGLWTAYVLTLFFTYTKVLGILSASNLLIFLLVYIMYKPTYLLLIYSLHKLSTKEFWKKLLGSFFLIISFDIISLPRLLIGEQLPDCASSVSNLGLLVIPWFDKYMPHTLSFSLFYIIIPIIAFALSMQLFGVIDFRRRLTNGGG